MSQYHCRHHFEYVKQSRPFTEREYMQCTKCGLQNPLGLFQHWDFERDGTPVKADLNKRGGKGWNANKGRTSGPHLQWGRDHDGETAWPAKGGYIRGHTGHGLTTDEYLELEKRRQESMKSVVNYVRRRYGRKPIVKVRSDEWGDAEEVYTVWLWECQICVKMVWTHNWQSTQQLANHHARNHHGGQVK